MITYRLVNQPMNEIDTITCDVCGKLIDDDMQVQEAYWLDFVGGYASVFGDGAHIRCDICQHCLKKLIGPYCYYGTEDGWKKLEAPNG